MPKNTAYIQEQHVVLPDSHALNHENGELTWAAAGDMPIPSIKDEEIVFITEYREDDKPGYLLCYLKETPVTASEDSDDTTPPFKLTRLFTPELPLEVLEKHLLKDVPEYFRTSPGRRLHVIVSTRSGVGQAERFFNEVLEPILVEFGLDKHEDGAEQKPADGQQKKPIFELMVTSSHESVKQFAHKLRLSEKSGRRETIILLSGDGGVVDLLNGRDGGSLGDSTRTKPTIALLPLGTANALFHSLNKPAYSSLPHPSPLVLGLRTLLRGISAPLPTFKASFSAGSTLVSTASPSPKEKTTINHLYGAIVISYGFHAQLVWESDTPEHRKYGDKRFGIVAEELLKESHAYRTKVETTTAASDKQKPSIQLLTTGTGPDNDQRYNYILAAMVSNLEKNFTISPASKPLDGRLRLVSFGAVGAAKTMEIMQAAYQEGKHVGMKWEGEGEDGPAEVGYDEIEEVKVSVLEEDERWRKVCIDGTIVEVPQGGWMSVKRVEESRLRVLVDRSVV